MGNETAKITSCLNTIINKYLLTKIENRNEYEEMRKQIESDRATLDINTDTTEVKPPPTRNLRRRVNQLNAYDYDSGCLDLASNSASLLIQGGGGGGGGANASSSISIGVSSSVGVAGMLNSSLCSVNIGSAFTQYANGSGGGNGTPTFSSYFASVAPPSSLPYDGSTSSGSNLVQSVNDRKRKLTTATIALGLNEDELNEDFKFLVKNGSLSKKELQMAACNSSPKVQLSSAE
jgi:hypothetical protein